MPRHKNQLNQRQRYSSSETESDSNRPNAKRMKAKSYSLPINLTMSSKPEKTSSQPQPDHTVSTNDLYQLMLTVKQNQDSLRTSLEQRITNLETKFTDEIKLNMKTLKDEMSLEFAQVDNKIKELEIKMSNFELNQQDTNNTQSSVIEKSVQSKLVFKNIKTDGVNNDGLKTYINGMLNALGLEFSVVSAQQIGNPNNGTVNTGNTSRPKPVIVIFADEKQRIDVLKNKRKLKDIDEYKNIYIETDRTRQERMHEANIRQIIKSIPALQFKGGRVTQKSN
ncbi:unnamed protein product [Mytilus coruscus]|uniref:Uncharacterized protein n=1 Tax=Mytilus coruscus TaxID=42192 RepID=A0A6J7ZWD7_MYTCO|nr:unnamed protein product [Mytilus coruscus]